MKNTLIFILFVLLTSISSLIHAAGLEQGISLTPQEQTWLKKKLTVRVRVEDWPPFQILDGGFKGISVDYLKTVFDANGIQYQFVSGANTPLKTAWRHLENHQMIDLIFTVKITGNPKTGRIVTDEYLSLPWVIFNRQDQGFISGIEDLNGKMVSVPEGYVKVLIEKNYPGIGLRLFPQGDAVQRCLHALATGEVDAYIGNLALGSYIIRKKGYANVKVAAPTPFEPQNQAMAVRDDWPELVSIINKSLGRISPEMHGKIRNKWLSVQYERGVDPKDLAEWVLGIIGMLVAILFIVMIWNRSLKREISERRRVEKELQNSEKRYQRLCEASFEGVLIMDDGVIIEANRVVCDLLGYTLAELIGKNSLGLVAPGVREDVQAKIQAGYEEMYETVGLTKDGVEFPIEVHARMFIYKTRQVRCAAIRDLSERQKARDALQESEKKFRAVATGAHDAIIMTDGDGKVTLWNDAAERIFQYTQAEMAGKDPHEVLVPHQLIETVRKKVQWFHQTGQGDAVGRTTELTAIKKSGEAFPIEMSLSAIQIKGKWSAIAIVREISERKKLEADLRRLATTDALTGVDNRRSFMEKAKHELRRSKRFKNPFSMIMIDIDHFKGVNDQYGHQVGDLVLQKMAETIQLTIRESDIFGRMGGEEFAVVMIEIAPEISMTIAERIRSRVEALRIEADQKSVHITISMGLSSYREGDDFETISKRADKSLYAAKEKGRNCVMSL